MSRWLADNNQGQPVAEYLENLHPSLKSLWNLENELRSALQNAILLRKDEAGKHMEEAKRHLENALHSIKQGGDAKASGDAAPPPTPAPENEALDYGEGPRADYGEGYRYRKSDLSKGADKSTEHTWAGGDHEQDVQNPTAPGQELGATKR